MAQLTGQHRFAADLVASLSALSADLGYLATTLVTEPSISRRTVVCVDWSEVFAFCASSPASPEDSASFVVGDARELWALHQAALCYLFVKFPGRIVLLPPYFLEMKTYADVLRREVLTAWLPPHLFRDAHRDVLADELVERALKLVAEKADHIEQYAPTERRLLLDVIQRHFAGVSLLTHLQHRDFLTTLTSLLTTRGGTGPRLETLEDLGVPDIARVHAAACKDKHVEYWHDVITGVSEAKKTTPLSTIRDAMALSYLAALNPLLLSHNRNVLFVTRDRALQKVMRARPGTFGSLASAGGPSQLSSTPMTRSWLYFLEFGGLFYPEGSETSTEIAKKIDIMRSRSFGARSWLRGLRTRDTSGVDDSEREHLRGLFEASRHLRNANAFLALNGLTLARSRGHEEEQLLALVRFLRLLLSPDVFRKEKESMVPAIWVTLRDLEVKLATVGMGTGSEGGPPGERGPDNRLFIRHFGATLLLRLGPESVTSRLPAGELRDGVVGVLESMSAGRQLQVEGVRLLSRLAAAVQLDEFDRRLVAALVMIGEGAPNKARLLLGPLLTPELDVKRAGLSGSHLEQAVVLYADAMCHGLPEDVLEAHDRVAECAQSLQGRGELAKHRFAFWAAELELLLDWSNRHVESVEDLPTFGLDLPRITHIARLRSHALPDGGDGSPAYFAFLASLLMAFTRVMPVTEIVWDREKRRDWYTQRIELAKTEWLAHHLEQAVTKRHAKRIGREASVVWEALAYYRAKRFCLYGAKVDSEKARRAIEEARTACQPAFRRAYLYHKIDLLMQRDAASVL